MYDVSTTIPVASLSYNNIINTLRYFIIFKKKNVEVGSPNDMIFNY